jgi:Zn-dependent peptidase ImmA (M78 family)
MTISNLRARAEYWRNRLNLKEWDIRVEWGAKKEMADAVGTCIWSAEELCAIVKLKRGEPAHEIEPTLVHELLHLVLQGHTNYDGKYDIHLERAINKLAAALCQTEPA